MKGLPVSEINAMVKASARKMDADAIGTALKYHKGKLAVLELPVTSYQHKVEKMRARYPDVRILTAYGDTLSDVPMLAMSEQPMAMYLYPKLLRVADERRWRVIPTSNR